jgi:hypothetical protein
LVLAKISKTFFAGFQTFAGPAARFRTPFAASGTARLFERSELNAVPDAPPMLGALYGSKIKFESKITTTTGRESSNDTHNGCECRDLAVPKVRSGSDAFSS